MNDWLADLVGDAFIEDRLSSTRQITDYLAVEAAYTEAAGFVGKFPEGLSREAADAIRAAKIDSDQLVKIAVRDGMPIPGLVAQLRATLPAHLHDTVHHGLTSQDVMDTAFCLALGDCLNEFDQRLEQVEASLSQLDRSFGARTLMARTRMQAALPIRVTDRISIWSDPFQRLRERLHVLRPQLLRIQLGGPVGDRSSFDGYGDAIADHMADVLGLARSQHAWHTDRTALADLAAWLVAVNGHLGKIGTDIALMAQQGIEDITLRGGGASSSMAHKSNPVCAELLVTLARDASAQLSTIGGILVHEQERSGAAWTLEWLVFPRLLRGCGAGLRLGLQVLEEVECLGKPDPA